MEKMIRISATDACLHSVQPMMKGYVVIALVLFIWSGFALSLRMIGASSLTPADVALIRFFVPCIVLIPWLRGHVRSIRSLKISDAALILLGGVPFFFLASFGAKLAPAAYVGTVLAGTPPFFVAIISFFLFRQQLSRYRLISLMLIIIGIVMMVIGNTHVIPHEILHGVMVLLGASFLWAIYTIGLKRAGINPIAITFFISICSLFIMLICISTGFVSSHLGAFSIQQALPFILIQGIGAGLLSTIGYSYVVGKFGATKSSIICSLSPGLTAMLAVPVLGESLSISILVGIFMTIAGVIFSNTH